MTVLMYYYKFSLDSNSKISLKIGQYLMKTYKIGAIFFGHPVYELLGHHLTRIGKVYGNSE